jgi:hypothetical protein
MPYPSIAPSQSIRSDTLVVWYFRGTMAAVIQRRELPSALLDSVFSLEIGPQVTGMSGDVQVRLRAPR